MSRVEEGRGRARQQRRTVAIDHDTRDYDRANARLPWGERILARNTLSIVYSTAASVPSACICWGTKTLVDAVSSNPDVRGGVWAALGCGLYEVSTAAFKSSAFENYLCNKLLHYIILVASWSAVFVATRGNLGASWAVMVMGLTWFAARLVNGLVAYSFPLGRALWTATFNTTVFVLLALAVAVRCDASNALRCDAMRCHAMRCEMQSSPHRD